MHRFHAQNAVKTFVALILILAAGSAIPAVAQEESENTPQFVTEEQYRQLEYRVNQLEQKAQAAAGPGMVALILFAAFCALWAQNTGRNPWLWFFGGLIFSVVAVLVLLYKNGEDHKIRDL